jgi:hypothetical protein
MDALEERSRAAGVGSLRAADVDALILSTGRANLIRRS